MKRLLFAAAASATLIAAPASAQVYFGADPGGVGVQVGPLGAGVGPEYRGRERYRNRDRFAYGDECRVIREQTVTPSGRTITTTRRICD
jgi:hypothetical protein